MSYKAIAGWLGTLGLASLFSLLLINKIEKFYDNSQEREEMNPALKNYYYSMLEFMKTRDPKTNQLPPDIKSRELAFASHLPTKESFYAFKRNPGNTIQTQSWFSRGPQNVTGRINAVEMDVRNPSIINAGAASGGMWRSMDGGASWLKTFPPNAVQNVYCTVQDTRQGKEDTWYCGTGELLSTTDRKVGTLPRTIGLGNGIYKSTDNGLSWFPLQSTLSSSNGRLNDWFQGTWNIVIDPIATDDVVLAACYGGIMRSTDGGNSWTNVLGDSKNKCFSSFITVSHDGVFYASLSSYTTTGAVPSSYGIYMSKDGVQWTNVTPASFPSKTRMIKLALAPSNENTIYAITEYPDPTGDPIFSFGSSIHTFWKGTINTSTEKIAWSDRSAGIKFNSPPTLQAYGSLGGYAFVLKVHPNDENIVFIGGTNLYRSTNGFADMNAVIEAGGYNTYDAYDPYSKGLHPDIHAITFNPQNPQQIYVGNDGGIHKSGSILSSSINWEPAKTGLVSTQFYSLGFDKINSDDFLIGGLQDNFTQYTKTSNPKDLWMTTVGGDGMTVAVGDGKSPVVCSVYNGYIWTVTFDNNMNLTSILYQRPDVLNDGDFEFYNTFQLDPNNNKTFYLLAKNHLWRKDDMMSAAHDTSLRNKGWMNLSKCVMPDSESMVSIAISKNPSNIVFVGTSKGRLIRIDDANTGNPGYIDITGPDFPKDAYLACIEVDPENADNIFAVFSNYNVQSVFYSSDGGATWTTAGGNLEENPDGSGAGPSIRWVKMLHKDGKTIYFAGTSVGLFSTTQLAGASTQWVQEGANTIGNTIIEMVEGRETDGLVVVATQGYGVFSTHVSIDGIEDRPMSNFSISQNYPNPARDLTHIDFSVMHPGIVEIELFDINGRKIRTLFNSYATAGRHTEQVNVSGLQSGAYCYKVTCPDGILTKKMIITE